MPRAIITMADCDSIANHLHAVTDKVRTMLHHEQMAMTDGNDSGLVAVEVILQLQALADSFTRHAQRIIDTTQQI